MVTSLAAFLLLAPAHLPERTVTLTPSDDVWVYPHASDPGTDSFLRVWGSDGKSVSADADHNEFSYGYLRFDLSGIQTGALKSATLVLTHAPSQGWTLATAVSNPLEARLLKGDFDEKTWSYDKIDKCAPDSSKDALLGLGNPDKLPEEGKAAKFEIDLMKSPTFGALLKPTIPNHVNIALASKVDPATLGRMSVYKFYSKDNADKSVQPTLKLVFQD